jgi:hypothetical protein
LGVREHGQAQVAALVPKVSKFLAVLGNGIAQLAVLNLQALERGVGPGSGIQPRKTKEGKRGGGIGQPRRSWDLACTAVSSAAVALAC